jgi:hypothetical protein
MIIDKKDFNKLKEYIDNLYWDQDRMSRDGVYFLNLLDKEIKKIENKSKNNIYVITSNCICDDESFNNILGLTTDLSYAKKLFNEEIESIKNDTDFNDLDVIKYDENINLNDSIYDNKWIMEETDKEFILYQNGNYNSNHFIVALEQRELEQELNKEILEDQCL